MTQRQIPFSKRMGIQRIEPLSMEAMPPELRVSLWNVVHPALWNVSDQDEYLRRVRWLYNLQPIRWPIDEVPIRHSQSALATNRLKEWMLKNARWDAIYDFVEVFPHVLAAGLDLTVSTLHKHRSINLSQLMKVQDQIQTYTMGLNEMLEREGAPYRYRDLLLIPITNESELSAIKQAKDSTPFAGARLHIDAAVTSLAQRPEPNFRNCVKESISAVESLLQEATGIKGAKLPPLLDAFEVKYQCDLHGAFKKALGSLYGWTSDDGGIRHGIFGSDTVTRADAQFMLVACSALVNLLASKTK